MDHNFYGPALEQLASTCSLHDFSPRCTYFQRQIKLQTADINPCNIFQKCCANFSDIEAYFNTKEIK